MQCGSTAVLLIHGLGGTAYDLGVLQKALRSAGAATHAPTLPGHGTHPQDLVGTAAEAWLETLAQAYRELIAEHATVHIAGMCMGALLALVLAHRVRHGIDRPQDRLALLATPIHIDGWSTPWYRELRHAVYRIPGMAARMRVEEDEPFGIKNPLLRRIIKAKLARGDSFHYPWVPLACIRQVDRLRRWARDAAPATRCETLIIHAREDELTSLRSAQTLQAALPRARTVVLENSYHMICVDNDRDQVAAEVLGFFGFDPAAATARRKSPATAD
ncbi:Carboxylesterase [Ralstonia mannitolilytica]|uniref:alpha/beta hydrolase n=1 Tax=Ralstonia mannitolilytica TaxID=105219 RepID=UPI0007AFFEA9|nr:alpha/beta fold hydrolase [Ralstonia mannitolilytica]ANA34342.1 esterase [Ralstonia mannitolilytica]CAJ0680721.1 Carboxylesterase [Ralstonia mannitolilytica]CAJ0774932.1 Carboxylesterase [Ralstonia mannitolilytica]CAJ0850993.1 Carboxylesterase [Ralstonia mannitolilytica]